MDQAITFALNGSDSLYADSLAMLITHTLTWVPAGIVLLYIIIKNNELPRLALIIAGLVACVLISNSLSEICKATFQRWRPSCDPLLMYSVQVVGDYRVGRFGFFSAHAANTMSVAVFVSMLFRKPRAAMLFIFWSILGGWSRIYLGVHYAGDVAVGFAVGAAVGALMMLLCRKISRGLMRPSGAPGYTSCGYLSSDVDVLTATLLSTFMVVAIAACFPPTI